MKNQYVGDINDFRKYSLLRALSGEGTLNIGVCWMLTPNDVRTDGSFTAYLDAPNKWRDYDSVVFDRLAECVHVADGRNVERIEAAGVLPNAVFFSNLLQDKAAERRDYFEAMKTKLAGTDLIFFDPDNGLEIKSRPLGRKDSSKFLFWNELTDSYAAGHSVLVYQHFNRTSRETFISNVVQKAAGLTGSLAATTFRTANTFFLLISQPKHRQHFAQQAEHISETWKSQITVTQHNLPDEVTKL